MILTGRRRVSYMALKSVSYESINACGTLTSVNLMMMTFMIVSTCEYIINLISPLWLKVCNEPALQRK